MSFMTIATNLIFIYNFDIMESKHDEGEEGNA